MTKTKSSHPIPTARGVNGRSAACIGHGERPGESGRAATTIDLTLTGFVTQVTGLGSGFGRVDCWTGIWDGHSDAELGEACSTGPHSYFGTGRGRGPSDRDGRDVHGVPSDATARCPMPTYATWPTSPTEPPGRTPSPRCSASKARSHASTSATSPPPSNPATSTRVGTSPHATAVRPAPRSTPCSRSSTPCSSSNAPRLRLPLLVADRHRPSRSTPRPPLPRRRPALPQHHHPLTCYSCSNPAR